MASLSNWPKSLERVCQGQVASGALLMQDYSAEDPRYGPMAAYFITTSLEMISESGYSKSAVMEVSPRVLMGHRVMDTHGVALFVQIVFFIT